MARVHPIHNEQCSKLEVLGDSALNLKSNDAGSVKTWLHLPASHPSWQEAATVRMGIIIRRSHEMDCGMIQQMLLARARKNKGETAKCATKEFEGRMKDLQTK